MTHTLGSLCTGYGGLDIAAHHAIGHTTTLWHADNDPAATALLDHHHPRTPNLGDITRADWAHVPPVDILTAGYPCQPFSDAGRRQGVTDPRHIWPHIHDAIRVLRPSIVVLENVRGHLRRGFPVVLGGLADIGYDARWVCLRAADIGAPHKRDRLFVVAYPDGAGRGGWPGREETPGRPRRNDAGRSRSAPVADPRGGAVRLQPVAHAGRQHPAESRHPDTAAADAASRRRAERFTETVGQQRQPVASACGARPADVAHPGGAGLENAGLWRADGTQRPPAERSGSAPVADAGHLGCQRHRAARNGWRQAADSDWSPRSDPGQWGPWAPAIARWEHVTGRAAPPAVELGTKGNRRLAAQFSEWMMGLPAGWVTGVPGLTRNQQLRLIGNGVVPQQGAEAIRRLLSM